MLIGSFSGIRYYDFLFHLGPVAAIGLFLNWTVLHWVHMRNVQLQPETEEKIPLPALDLSHLRKPVVVVTAVVIGFFFGVPPAMMAALGAAALLITRTLEPRRLYQEVDWGLLVFFIGLFLIVGGAENAGIVGRLLGLAEHWNLQRLGTFTVVVALLGNIVSNVPAVMLLKSLIPGFSNPHTAWLALAMASTLGGKSYNHGKRGQSHCGGKRPAGDGNWVSGIIFGLVCRSRVATLLVGWGWLAWVQ